MGKKNPVSYVRPNILALEPYSTARDEFQGGMSIDTWIDANENPFNNGVNRYPDPHQRELKRVVGALKGVSPDRLFLGGAGSDEAIDLIIRIFCRPGVDNIVTIAPTYGVYKVAAAVNDVAVRTVKLHPDFSLPVEELLQSADTHTKVMWICSPNNPTGNAFPPAQLLELAERFDGILVIDEAYVDFSAGGSLVGAIDEHPNIIVLQTFSKAWGMAGLRLGMAIADERVAALMARVKHPYNINGPTQREVADRIRRADIKGTVKTILDERARLEAELPKMPSVVEVFPSDANFLLVRFTDADEAYVYLMSRGILPRNRSSQPLCESTLRITVGTPDENTRLLKALADYRPGE